MFEHRSAPLLPRHAFRRRLFKSFLWATILIATSLGMGVIGYHSLAGLCWVDSLLNASMILSGMGPVDSLPTNSAKVFASIYALFSGAVFLSGVALVFAPVFHRFLHRFHLEGGRDSNR
jgi:hypothetical protein